LVFVTDSLPAWRIDQPASEESNSSVKKRGNGVGESSRVAVGAGISVAGIGVCEAGSVAIENGEGAGVGVTVWQAVMRSRHPIRRSFFMVLIKTQLSGALFQTIVFTACFTKLLKLICSLKFKV
jgi:hypothetical protein